jgi:hypothetical protein
VNTLQKALSTVTLAIVAGLGLFPAWDLRWTVRFDYDYGYEADLPADRSPALRQHGRELVTFADRRRGFLFTGPCTPATPLPPPRLEAVGSGIAKLGRRLTTYTRALVLDRTATPDLHEMLIEIGPFVGAMAVLVILFRGREQGPPPGPPPAWYKRGAPRANPR